jgi:hypothetical protein
MKEVSVPATVLRALADEKMTGWFGRGVLVTADHGGDWSPYWPEASKDTESLFRLRQFLGDALTGYIKGLEAENERLRGKSEGTPCEWTGCNLHHH